MNPQDRAPGGGGTVKESNWLFEMKPYVLTVGWQL